MNRREFIAGVGLAASWPLIVSAQQPRPVIGYINTGPGIEAENRLLEPFKRGLTEAGFLVGDNVAIEPVRVASLDQLPAAIDDLMQKGVAVMYGATTAAIAAKRATSTIPIVFLGDDDPVANGLVSTFNHPGGNVTGVRLTVGELPSKLVDIIHDLVPSAATIGLMINPKFASAEGDAAKSKAAAESLGIEMTIERIIDQGGIDDAFARMSLRNTNAALVDANRFFFSYRHQLASLAIQYRVQLGSGNREYALAGCLMSYGANRDEMIKQAGLYVGRILKGEKPADLPVIQPTKFELVINLKTAKALGLTVPPTLLARADEVIE